MEKKKIFIFIKEEISCKKNQNQNNNFQLKIQHEWKSFVKKKNNNKKVNSRWPLGQM